MRRIMKNLARRFLTMILCLAAILMMGMCAQADETGLTPTVAQVTLQHAQFGMQWTMTEASEAEVNRLVEQINAKLMTNLCGGTSFSYDSSSGSYVRYDTPVVYQLNADFAPYLLSCVTLAQKAQEAEALYLAACNNKALTKEELTGFQYQMECAKVSAIDDAMTFSRAADGSNHVTLRVSARYLTAYPLDQTAAPVPYVLAGEMTTCYRGSTLDRVENLKLASKALSERIVMPGESVSCSTVFKPRSSRNGYKYASVFQNGQKVDGIGGGICQVSTTLYNALLNAGVKVTERHPHSMQVDYVPLGLDAAIATGYKDLVFRNNYTQPIYLQSEVRNADVACRVYVAAAELGNVRYRAWANQTGKLTADTYVTKVQDGVDLETSYVDSSRYYK